MGARDDDDNLAIDFKTTLEVALERGQNLIIFGYGYSGSGKTYTLDKLRDVVLHSGYDLKLEDVFEIYAKNPDAYSEAFAMRRMGEAGQEFYIKNSQFSPLYQYFNALDESEKDNRKRMFDILTKPHAETTKDIKNYPSYVNMPKDDTITSVLETVHKIRRTLWRIKPTKNNRFSSRSHLFYTLRVSDIAKGKVAKVTFVDMGGRETPVDMVKTVVKDSVGVFNLSSIMKGASIPKLTVPFYEGFEESDGYPVINGKLCNSSTCIKILADTINEGVMINETINQLQYFIERHAKKKRKDEISIEEIDRNIKDIESKEKSDNWFFTKNPEDEELYKVLMDMTNNGNNFMFLMMCCVRPGKDFCDAVQKTVKFAQSVSNKNKNNLTPENSELVSQVLRMCNQLIDKPKWPGLGP